MDEETLFPNYLSRYYENAKGPFLNLSDFVPAEAEELMKKFRQRGDVFASKRTDDYLKIRRGLMEC
ncbi:MAG: hypothetical protein JXM69_13170 [Anaerolineae bacterium]|nr:hypothetical protein [Anaerolineae bacterium]